jgi:hypothetical protein
MAYPVKEYTAAEYFALSTEVYEDVTSEKIYYMPAITDGIASWTLNIYDVDDPEGSPIVTLNDTVIGTGYRVLMTTELSGTITGQQQSHLVTDNGTFGNKQWINAGMSLANLPIGTVVSWTIFTQSYEATTAGSYVGNNEFIGTFLKQIVNPFVLPNVNTFVYTSGEDVEVYKYRLYVFNNDSELILNQEFDPTTYQITGFIIKNEATIMQ